MSITSKSPRKVLLVAFDVGQQACATAAWGGATGVFASARKGLLPRGGGDKPAAWARRVHYSNDILNSLLNRQL